jgi:glycosyltransferase involved in cell wall biosynthesis
MESLPPTPAAPDTGTASVRVSVLIPVYNEFLTMPLVLQRVLSAPLPPGCEKEVIVVDDGSTDGTTTLLDNLLKQHHDSALLLVHQSPVNFGKGAALRLGLAKATGDIILVQDGDLEYDPNDYTKIIQPILEGKADVVYGSRFTGAMHKSMKFANWLANRILTISSNVMFGARITDEATAYKAFRTSVLRNLRLECIRFEFCPEVTAKVRRLGYAIHEVPISYNPRGVLEGKKIRWQDGVEAMWTLLRFRFAPLERFDRRVSGAAVPVARAQPGESPR